MAICIATNSYKSSSDGNAVVNRIQVLISFVLASYVTIVVNRWDRIRNTTLGQEWGAIENLNLIAYRLIQDNSEQAMKLKDMILRYGRVAMLLTFKALQADGNLTNLKDQDLLTDDEEKWLSSAAIGTRPLVVVSWISKYFENLHKFGYIADEQMNSLIVSNVASLR